MSFNLVKLTDEYMTRKRISFPRQAHLRPSEASVVWVDEHGIKRTAGSCLRQSYYRLTGVSGMDTDAYSEWVFALGKAVEVILVEQWKQMGIWVDNNLKFYWPEYNISGEVDCILRDPTTAELVLVECCTPDTLVLQDNYTLSSFDKLEKTTTISHLGNVNNIKNIQLKNVTNETIFQFHGKFDGLTAKYNYNHPILTAKVKIRRLEKNNKQRSYFVEECKFKKASEIKRGDYICIPKAKFGQEINNDLYSDISFLLDKKLWDFEVIDNYVYPKNKQGFNNYKPIPNNIKNLKDFYWLLGLYLAEGSCGRSAVYFSLNKNETNIINRIEKTIHNLFGLEIKVRLLKDSRTKEWSNGINVSINSIAFVKLIKSIIPGNSKNRTKHLNYNKIKFDLDLLDSMLLGIWQGDGTEEEFGMKIGTVVPHLAFLYFQLGAYIGLNPTLKRYNQQSLFNSDFIYVVEFNSGGNKNNIEKLVESENFWCYKVKQIKKEKYSGILYNLECDPDNTFTTGLIITHNCKSMYGYNAHRDICGNTKQAGKPKTSQMLQLCVYLKYLKEFFPYGKLVYYSRDSAHRAEFNIRLKEESPNCTRIYINDIPDKRFYVENILNRYTELNQYLSMNAVPAADYEWQYSDEKIEKLYEIEEIGKTKYQDWKKGKEIIGDWQCKWCQFHPICWGE